MNAPRLLTSVADVAPSVASRDARPVGPVRTAPEHPTTLLARLLRARPPRRPSDHYWDHREASWVAPVSVEHLTRRTFPS